VSTGNALFDPGMLGQLPEAAAGRGDTDFAGHILPEPCRSRRSSTGAISECSPPARLRSNTPWGQRRNSA
jgi:hypothetical protein